MVVSKGNGDKKAAKKVKRYMGKYEKGALQKGWNVVTRDRKKKKGRTIDRERDCKMHKRRARIKMV